MLFQIDIPEDISKRIKKFIFKENITKDQFIIDALQQRIEYLDNIEECIKSEGK